VGWEISNDSWEGYYRDYSPCGTPGGSLDMARKDTATLLDFKDEEDSNPFAVRNTNFRAGLGVS